MKCIQFEELLTNDTVRTMLDLVKLAAIVFIITHWSACMFYGVGYAELNTTPDCWIVRAQFQDVDDYEVLYVQSLYFAFLTIATIGYGDITPVTELEKICVIAILFCACAVFSYVVGYIASLVGKNDTIIAEFK